MDLWLYSSPLFAGVTLSVMPPLIGAMLIVMVYLPLQMLFNALWAGIFKGIHWLGSTAGVVPFWGPAILCSIATILIALHNSSWWHLKWVSPIRALFYETVPKSGLTPLEIMLIWLFLSALGSIGEWAWATKNRN